MLGSNLVPENNEDDFILDVNRSPDIINEIVNPHRCFHDEDAETHSAPLPDIPWEDMEEMCIESLCQNELLNEADIDEYRRNKFDDDFDNEVSPSISNVEIDATFSDNEPDTPEKEIISGANIKAPKYVDNGTSPMLVAERFIKENPIFKLNNRLYLYNLDNKPCYTEVSDDTLCEVLFEQYKALFMREQPGLALQVCKSIRIQLKGVPKEAILKYEARYVAARNAIIDLKKDRVIDHTPGIILRYYLDLDVDLNNSHCPTFVSFIKDAASEKINVTKSIYEMLAYLIFPTEFKKAIFCIIGPPNSGKSIISGLLQSLFGNGCVSNESLCDLGKNFRSGNYAEARLNIDGDLPNQVIGEKEIGILKRISGGDRIVSEVKYQQSYSTSTECKFLVCSNHKLMLKSPDNAFLYRLHVIPFDNPVSRDKMDFGLSKKLGKEKTGIFTVIYKWYKLLKNNDYKFSDCVDINEYCSVCDKSQNADIPYVIDDFFNEHFNVTGINADFVPSSEIEKLFRDYCQQNQIEYLIPGFAQKFSRFISECYGEEVRNARRGNNKARGYCGMRMIIE